MAGTGAVLAPHAARPARGARGDCRGGRGGWRAGATLRQPFGINVRNGCRAVTRPEREPRAAAVTGADHRVAGPRRGPRAVWLARVCSRCDIYRSTYGLTFLIKAAASVLARATTATAPRNTRWVAVPRCRREGRAPPPDQSPTSRCPAHTSCSWPPAHLGSLPCGYEKVPTRFPGSPSPTVGHLISRWPTPGAGMLTKGAAFAFQSPGRQPAEHPVARHRPPGRRHLAIGSGQGPGSSRQSRPCPDNAVIG